MSPRIYGRMQGHYVLTDEDGEREQRSKGRRTINNNNNNRHSVLSPLSFTLVCQRRSSWKNTRLLMAAVGKYGCGGGSDRERARERTRQGASEGQ